MEAKIEDLYADFAALSEVEAIALGGSRAGDVFDEKSDYDVYVYCSAPPEEDVRREILSRYCGAAMEIGNHFWEYEDNCTFKNGVDIDILYRNLDDFVSGVAAVVERAEAHNGYTTCMWHNLRTCRVIFDRAGRLAAAKTRFDVPYPSALKRNIIARNRRLLADSLPAYKGQIAKAVRRCDLVSVNHRTAAFFESYFDIIFALNEKTHPGEKRLVALARAICPLLPRDFEENIASLFRALYADSSAVDECIARIVRALDDLLAVSGFEE